MNKLFSPLWARPINLFEAHGSICCEQMLHSYEDFKAGPFYQAKSITEANLVVLWGSFSRKLAKMLNEPLEQGVKKYVLHMQGCERRVNNQFSFASLNELLPVNRTIAHCGLSFEELKALNKEVWFCLRA